MLFIVDVDNDGFKVYDSSGTLIDPATDAVVQAVRDRIGEISATPTTNTLMDRVKNVLSKLTEIDTVLDAINLTTGLKKIVDALPIGDNIIGRAKVTDGTDVLSILNEGTSVGAGVYGVMAGGLDPSDNAKWIELDADGRIRVASVSEASDPTKRVFAALEDSGGDQNMYVDGSGTPVEYSFDADSTDDIYVTKIRVVINAADIQFKDGSGSGTFHKIDAITNGLKLEVRSNSTTVELANFKRDEDFLAFGGNDIIDQTDTSDLLTATYESSGVVLKAGTGDFVKVTVRDDLENAGHIFLGCWIKGYKK